MGTWNEVIFRIIEKSNCPTITLHEIYQLMKTHPLVTPYHRQSWKIGGQARYECWTRKCLSNLVHSGRIKRVGRASYSLNSEN